MPRIIPYLGQHDQVDFCSAQFASRSNGHYFQNKIENVPFESRQEKSHRFGGNVIETDQDEARRSRRRGRRRADAAIALPQRGRCMGAGAPMHGEPNAYA